MAEMSIPQIIYQVMMKTEWNWQNICSVVGNVGSQAIEAYII